MIAVRKVFWVALTYVLPVLLFSTVGFNSDVKAAPKPEVFGQLPKMYDAAISPTGNEVAAIVNGDGKYFIVIYEPFGNAEPKVVGLDKGVKPRYVKWVNDKRVIFSFWQSEEVRGTPFTTGYLYTLDTTNMKGKILIKPKDIWRQYNNVIVDWLEDDPDHILMAFDEVSYSTTPDVKKVNVETGRFKTIKRGLKGVQYWDTDFQGRLRIGQGRREDKDATEVLRVFDLETEKWLNHDSYPGLKGDTVIFGFTGNDNELIIGDYRGQETLGAYIYDLDEKKITRKVFHNETYDTQSVVISRETGEVSGVRYTDETPQLEMLDNYDGLFLKTKALLEGNNVRLVDQNYDGSKIIIRASNPTDSGMMLFMSSELDRPAVLSALYPGLSSNDLGEVISVRYTARDGQKIPAFVTLPPTVKDTAQIKKLPFIILPHGGPYGRDAKRFDWWAQFFASRGYGVLQMNFRGSDGYGKSFEESGRRNWVIMQEDVEDGTRWLMEKGYADPERTCIAGWSYGGYASLMGAAKNPDLYNCAIAMAAMTDIKRQVRDMKRYQFGKANAKNFIGKGFENKDDVKANSPVRIAEDITIPVFLAHGEKDQRVDYTQYTMMRRALKKSKADVTEMSFEDEDHFLSNQKNRQDFVVGIAKFLEKHNGPSEFIAK